MKIEPGNSIGQGVQVSDYYSLNEVNPAEAANQTASTQGTQSTEMKQTLDNATGLLQSITTDKLSDQVIRKMPPDEYLQLLSLLDNIISGSIDKQV